MTERRMKEIEDLENQATQRLGECNTREANLEREKKELADGKRVLEQIRHTAELERRQALVKVKAADRYMRTQGALVARTTNQYGNHGYGYLSGRNTTSRPPFLDVE